MRSVIALTYAHWRAALSYRLQHTLSVISLIASVVPLYFVANALQPVMEPTIAAEGGQYFGFLIIGMVAFLLLPVTVNTMPGEVGSGISKGTLEALLSTQATPFSILFGMMGYALSWTGLRACMLLLTGWILGANILWSHFGAALVIMALIVVAHIPFGMIATALVIAFRTSGPVSRVVLTLSALLGGVYYPTQVIPSWLELVSDFVPLSYGLRALRMTMLEGMSLAEVLPQLGMLGLFALVLTMAGMLALSVSFRYARRMGTLSQY